MKVEFLAMDPVVETIATIQEKSKAIQYIMIQIYRLGKGPEKGPLRMDSLSVHVQLRK